MSEITEFRHLKLLAAISLMIGTFTSLCGSAFFKASMQFIVWEFAEMFTLTAYTVLSAIYLRMEQDLVSAAFNLLIVGSGFTIAANAGEKPDFSTYATGLILYIPGYILLAFFSKFRLWIRICCLLLCISFGITAFRILHDHYNNPKHPIEIAGYIIRTAIFTGWIIELLKRNKKAEEA